MKVELLFPEDFELERKELHLSDIEVQVLLASKKIGSEGEYFIIEELIFEDLEEGYSITILLENE